MIEDFFKTFCLAFEIPEAYKGMHIVRIQIKNLKIFSLSFDEITFFPQLVANLYPIDYFFIVFRISHKNFDKNFLFVISSIGNADLCVKNILAIKCGVE
jgi:hypothetical protein